jgi:hypothetical protein
MTNQQTNHQLRPRREDYKVQKLIEQIEMKIVLEAKEMRETKHATSTN